MLQYMNPNAMGGALRGGPTGYAPQQINPMIGALMAQRQQQLAMAQRAQQQAALQRAMQQRAMQQQFAPPQAMQPGGQMGGAFPQMAPRPAPTGSGLQAGAFLPPQANTAVPRRRNRRGRGGLAPTGYAPAGDWGGGGGMGSMPMLANALQGAY